LTRLIDRAGGGLQTFKAWTFTGHIDRQRTFTAAESVDVDVSALSASPASPRQAIAADGSVTGECSAPVVKVLRGSTTYTMVVQSSVIEEDNQFRMTRRFSGIFQAPGSVTWVGGDGNNGGGSAWTIDNRSNRPIKFTLWVETRAGMSGVWFRHRLENDGGAGLGGHAHPANDSFYDRLWVEFNRPVSGTNLTLRQDHVISSQSDESQNFRQVLNGVTTTARHSGEVEIGGGWLGVKWFWEKYPKGVIVNGTRVEVDLFPDAAHEFTTSGQFGSGNHLIVGIWTSTHDFAIGPTVEDVRRLLWPPAVIPAVEDIRPVWGPIAPLIGDTDPLVDEAMERQSRFHRAVFSPAASSDGATIEVLREHRGYWPNPRQIIGSWYGEQRFGCVFKGGNPGQPAMNIYDWPYIMWLQAIRHKSAELWTLAEEMTQHTRDYDRWKVRHSDGSVHGRPSPPEVQGQMGVWNWEDGNYNSGTRFQHIGPQAVGAGATGSHSWNGGDALGYLLTGDRTFHEGTLEGAEGWWEVYQDFYSIAPDGPRFNTNRVTTRAISWTGLQWLNAYRVTGDPVWLDRALLAARTLVHVASQPYLGEGRTESTPESDWGKYTSGTGDIGGGAIVETGPNSFIYDRGLAIVTFLMYPLEPLMEIHEAAKAAGRPVSDIEADLLLRLNYLRTKAWKGGQVSADGLSRIPWQTSYRTDPEDPISTTHTYMNGTTPGSIDNHKNRGSILQYNHFAASLAAYCAKRIMSPGAEADAAFQWAKDIYRDQFLLIPYSPNLTTFVPYTQRGKVNLSQDWPATNTAKVWGWLGRGGQVFLDVLAEGAPAPPEPTPEPPDPEPGDIMATINLAITLENQQHAHNYTDMEIRFQRSTDGQLTWADVQSNNRPLGTTEDAYPVPSGQPGHYRGVARLTDSVNFSPEVFSNVGEVVVFDILTPSTVTLSIVAQ
jgi:hypothetical protein